MSLRPKVTKPAIGHAIFTWRYVWVARCWAIAPQRVFNPIVFGIGLRRIGSGGEIEFMAWRFRFSVGVGLRSRA